MVRMTTPRRSSRLRGSSPQKHQHDLPCVSEHNSSDEYTQPALDFSASPAPRTPRDASPLKPAFAEMHPALAHNNGSKIPSIEKRLISMPQNTNRNAILSESSQNTPSKTPFASSFDFKLNGAPDAAQRAVIQKTVDEKSEEPRQPKAKLASIQEKTSQGPAMSAEARKLMEELRDETARIKAQLTAELEAKREAQKTLDESILGRKFARPKGKSGRFSDLHSAEFDKMDSIANHASAYRNQPGRSQGVASQGLKRSRSKTNLDEDEDGQLSQTPRTERTLPKGLKRSQSKAELDSKEDSQAKLKNRPLPALPGSSIKKSSSRMDLNEKMEASQDGKSMVNFGLKRTQSKANLNDKSLIPNFQTERPDNQTSNKRVKRDADDGPSHARPVSQGNSKPSSIPVQSQPSTPSASRTQLYAPSSITTPTKASLSRAASVRSTASKIPSLATPKMTIGNTFKRLSKSVIMGGQSGHKKSILKRYNPASHGKPSIIPVPSAASSPIRGFGSANVNKDLPPVPTPSGLPRSRSMKHVAFDMKRIRKFSATTNDASHASANTNTNAQPIEYPDLSLQLEFAKFPAQVDYPSLTRPPGSTGSNASKSPLRAPSTPSMFTFRGDQTIQSGASPNGFGASPGQSSVRQVRHSMLPGGFASMARVPQSAPAKAMSSKKRSRVEDDDETDAEAARRAGKRSKIEDGAVSSMTGRMDSMPEPSVQTPSKKKKTLSLSRLNMLARPKKR